MTSREVEAGSIPAASIDRNRASSPDTKGLSVNKNIAICALALGLVFAILWKTPQYPRPGDVLAPAASKPAPPVPAATIGFLALDTVDVQLLTRTILREKYAVAKRTWYEVHDQTSKHVTGDLAGGGRGPLPCAGCLAAENGDWMGDTNATAFVVQRLGIDLRTPFAEIVHVKRVAVDGKGAKK